jgi:hypothetical protein
MVNRMTDGEFQRPPEVATRAAATGPVYITDRGCPTHVLLTYAAYEGLTGDAESGLDRLGHPVGVESVHLGVRRDTEVSQPADFG